MRHLTSQQDADYNYKQCFTWVFYFQLCVRHLTSQQDADYHYKAVCRALAAEAAELTTFLDKVTRGNEVRKDLQSMASNNESKVTIENVTQHYLIFPFSNLSRDMFIHTISSSCSVYSFQYDTMIFCVCSFKDKTHVIDRFCS